MRTPSMSSGRRPTEMIDPELLEHETWGTCPECGEPNTRCDCERADDGPEDVGWINEFRVEED